MKLIVFVLSLSLILCSYPGYDSIDPEKYIDPSEISAVLKEKINEKIDEMYPEARREAEQLGFILPTGEEILEYIKELGKYEATTHAEDKHFNRFWNKMAILFPTFYSTLVLDHDNVKMFKIDGWNPELASTPHVILRAVDDEEGSPVEGDSHEYCNWPHSAGPFDPEIITCNFPYFPPIHGKKYVVVRMETKLELIGIAIVVERLTTYLGWVPQRPIVIISSRNHHKMDGGKVIVEWLDEPEENGVNIAVQYMISQGWVAETCVDEQSFALVYGYQMANVLPLYPAFPIGTSQPGIDLYRIRTKGLLNKEDPNKLDHLNDIVDITQAIMSDGNTNLECDVENSITLKETLSEWFNVSEAYIRPEYLEAAKSDGFFRRTVCKTVIGTNIYTNNLEFFDFDETRSPYDKNGVDIIVQVTYPHESSSQETESVFRQKLQDLMTANPGKLEVDLLYSRPTRPKASKLTYWYQLTEGIIHEALDDIIMQAFGVPIVVPQFQAPGSFDLFRLDGVCQNMYSFQFYTMEFTCPDMVTTFAPEVNIGLHGHGCGSMYSEDFVKNMVDGNAYTMIQL